ESLSEGIVVETSWPLRCGIRRVELSCFQLFEKLFAESAIVSGGEFQDFSPQIRRRGDRVPASSLRLLEFDLFFGFAVAFLIRDFSGFPCFAEQQTCLFCVHWPECVADSCKRAGAESLILKCARVGGKRDQQRTWATAAGALITNAQRVVIQTQDFEITAVAH